MLADPQGLEFIMSRINSIAELEALYGLPQEMSIAKETTWITPHYRALIEASPFAVLATSGPEGLDCSPRGDKPGFVRIHDDRTLLLPAPVGQQERPVAFVEFGETSDAGQSASTRPDPRRTDRQPHRWRVL
jgi:hypothetical protein